jgi:ribonucleoside-diphosphate reductase alpha chain
MSLAEAHHAAPIAPRTVVAAIDVASTPDYQVIRRNGGTTRFNPSKIAVALTKAFLAVEGNSAAASRRVHEVVEGLTDQVVSALTRRPDAGRTFHIEDIQDQVELALMRGEHHKVARVYVLYRETRARARGKSAAMRPDAAPAPSLHLRTAEGDLRPFDAARFARVVEEACAGLDGLPPRRSLRKRLTISMTAYRSTNWRWLPSLRPGCWWVSAAMAFTRPSAMVLAAHWTSCCRSAAWTKQSMETLIG